MGYAALSCDRCGGTLDRGYEERDYGREPETGYADIEYVCLKCLEEESRECKG